MNVALDEQDVARIAEAVVSSIDTRYKRSPWLTKQEAAEYLRCSTRHIDQLVYLGELPAYHPCGKRLFSESDLKAYVHQTKEA